MALMRTLRSLARQGWTFAVLVVAAIALFYLAYSLSGANLGALMAAGVVFGCLVTLFIAARQGRAQAAPKPPRVTTSLVTPTVLVNEIRAAALVSLGQIGTVTIKKERDKTAEAESMLALSIAQTKSNCTSAIESPPPPRRPCRKDA